MEVLYQEMSTFIYPQNLCYPKVAVNQDVVIVVVVVGVPVVPVVPVVVGVPVVAKCVVLLVAVQIRNPGKGASLASCVGVCVCNISGEGREVIRFYKNKKVLAY